MLAEALTEPGYTGFTLESPLPEVAESESAPCGTRPTRNNNKSTHTQNTHTVDTTSFMVASIKRGDKFMESEFCSRFYPSILGLMRFYCRDKTIAEDITQEVLMNVLLKLRDKGIDHPERLSSYVRQTAKYTYLGWSRKMINKAYLHESEETQLCPSANPEQPAIDAEQRELILDMIQRMAVERDREVLSRCYLHDETKQSICDALALSHTHFDRIISRARLRFRLLLEGESADVQYSLAF